jgi:hypothetical protein
LKSANKRQDVAQVHPGAVILPPGRIRVDGALPSDLIVDALQKPDSSTPFAAPSLAAALPSAAWAGPRRALTAPMETGSASPGTSSATAAPAVGPARRAATPLALTNARHERVPCELTPWAALRSLAERFAFSPRSPSPRRPLQPAARRPTCRGGASSPEESLGEPGPASGHTQSSSESSVLPPGPHAAREGGHPPTGLDGPLGSSCWQRGAPLGAPTRRGVPD